MNKKQVFVLIVCAVFIILNQAITYVPRIEYKRHDYDLFVLIIACVLFLLLRIKKDVKRD